MADRRTSDAVFERLDAEVIRAGLCTHCGACIGLSGGALVARHTARGPLPAPASGRAAALDPIAYEVCPGRGVNYPAAYDFVFGRQPDNWLIGPYRRVYVGYAGDPVIRRAGASGGVITQTLVYLLEQGQIDGAVVLQQGHPNPWTATPVIGRTPEAVIAASQSVYVPSPVNTILPEMADFDGRLAYVGLPDQVAALRRLQQLGYPGACKVDYVLGPYVGTMMYLGAIESFLRAHGVRSLAEVVELRYRAGAWPGYLQIKLRSGRVLRAEKFYYNYLIPFYITQSTLLSVDFTNELTDISVGDAWHPRYEAMGTGHSVVVARTAKGEALLDAMQAQGCVALDEIPVDEALAMHGHMIDFKKRGAFIRIGWRRALGRRAPDYGYRPRRIPLARRLVEVVIAGLFWACGTWPARRAVEWVPLRVIGPLFDTLRKTWKRASRPTKRAGLRDVSFVLTPAKKEATPMTEAGFIARVREEIGHLRRADWSFADVGAHWDATEDYDEINEHTYSYFRRFTDGLRLSDVAPGSHVLDFCARTGNGVAYFYQNGKVGSAVCADVSAKMGEICAQRVRAAGLEDFTWVQVLDYDFPFETATFDAVLCFETVEHFPEPERIVSELGRVIKPGGVMVLTTPNVLWEPVHALAAILNLHHSEGPHRFIRYGRLLSMVKAAGFEIERVETTVLIPGGPGWLVRLGERIEAATRRWLMPLLGLRRVIVARRR
ncbi:MAG: Coenzyme F420 hydrogenase/dehydrogenase, beta subunit C-terminal domain [Anaerolineae bacterium]|nr:Coenzyme F420 hydrogenase/dehydrogenase, beta subunit C-terminal domain [Anaerolineae bacterium]